MTTSQTRYVYDTELNVHITAIWCGECGVPFGLAKSFIAARKEDNKTWYCPNGHARHYPPGGTAEEKRLVKLEEEKARLERQLKFAREDRDSQRERRLFAERQRAAAKGQVTKIKNRVAAGVCPCCNRTFQNLARHIAEQHLDFAGSES